MQADHPRAHFLNSVANGLSVTLVFRWSTPRREFQHVRRREACQVLRRLGGDYLSEPALFLLHVARHEHGTILSGVFHGHGAIWLSIMGPPGVSCRVSWCLSTVETSELVDLEDGWDGVSGGRCDRGAAAGLPLLGLARRYGDTPVNTACGGRCSSTSSASSRSP